MIFFLLELLFFSTIFFCFTPDVERLCTLDAIEAVHLGQEGEFDISLSRFKVTLVISVPPYIERERHTFRDPVDFAHLEKIRERFSSKNYTCETTNEKLLFRDVLKIDKMWLRGQIPLERMFLGWANIAIFMLMAAEYVKYRFENRT